MIKDRIILLDKIKSLFLYSVKFFKDSLIVLKEYLKNCIVNKPDQRLIIIIINNKRVFFKNNNC